MPAMYSGVLLVHSWLRWAVLIVGVVAVVRGMAGWTGGRPWLRADDRTGYWFAMLLDVQMLLGLLLYFALSPFTRQAMADFGAAMQNSGLRFWAVEHVLGMAIAITLAHVGRARVKKATDAVCGSPRASRDLSQSRPARDHDVNPVAWNAQTGDHCFRIW